MVKTLALALKNADGIRGVTVEERAKCVRKREQPCVSGRLFSSVELRELVAHYATAGMSVTNEEPDNKGAETPEAFMVSTVST